MKKITKCGYEDVYNMEVSEIHDFAIQGNVIVHNCADEMRYVFMARPMTPPEKEPDKILPYDPLSTDEDTKYDHYDFYRTF